jgi:hypothetical protein
MKTVHNPTPRLDPAKRARASLGLPACNTSSAIASPSRKAWYDSLPLIPVKGMRGG